MFASCLEQMSGIYDNMDSILITDRDGIIEYCALIDLEDHTVKNEGYTGKYLLEVYPDLTEEESTIFRVMKTGEPIIDEVQTLTDCNGKTLTFSCSTYPIELNGEIIGAVEGTIMLSENGEPCSKRIGRREKTQGREDRYYCLDDMVTQDPHMEEVKEQILRSAAGESTVMVIGDTGTGKEVAAQAIHSHSRRAKGPFVSQNCSAIPAGLLESTLFGTVKGSYTGAENRKGLFEMAHNGTLFLDELNSMDISLQGKILKAVEEQKIRRVGEEEERRIDVRIVSAVNREPRDIIEEQEMRRDLYYRLSVVQIRLPLLRDRKRDIPLLIDHYIEYYNRRSGKKLKGCSKLAMQMLMSYSWPGNVRELRNVIEYGFNMAEADEITVRDIPAHLLYDKKPEAAGPESCKWKKELNENKTINEIVGDFEKNILRQVLSETDNITEAARQLHISRQALRYKMEKYRLEK
ncbi:sigma 54-interacting transcriptional regulator [Anaerovorax odorimutans]|uniref:Sigma 54-interacting transcriptional regulator n=1 Tax=Anaerovorax odorimutans TaxID=109327 RepID=A0ABT1RSX7_9FIRM|nr:sigma 54-interacting transcriptional regulator [Anaerovorax odorimutans]MCQ4638295.1 sigma 54-interacting transcriptional regulator [Anaerovorax odorimutans]